MFRGAVGIAHGAEVSIQAQTIIQTVGYITGGIVLIAGILVISGYIVPSYVPANFRLIAGLVLILYGLYRPAMIYIKSKNAERADEKMDL